MARRTKIVGIAGRFGPRYGFTLRRRWRDVMERRYADHMCPFCGTRGHVKRLSTGVWTCTKCGSTWAGGAYVPRTELNKHFPKIVIREEF